MQSLQKKYGVSWSPKNKMTISKFFHVLSELFNYNKLMGKMNFEKNLFSFHFFVNLKYKYSITINYDLNNDI